MFDSAQGARIISGRNVVSNTRAYNSTALPRRDDNTPRRTREFRRRRNVRWRSS